MEREILLDGEMAAAMGSFNHVIYAWICHLNCRLILLFCIVTKTFHQTIEECALLRLLSTCLLPQCVVHEKASNDDDVRNIDQDDDDRQEDAHCRRETVLVKEKAAPHGEPARHQPCSFKLLQR